MGKDEDGENMTPPASSCQSEPSDRLNLTLNEPYFKIHAMLHLNTTPLQLKPTQGSVTHSEHLLLMHLKMLILTPFVAFSLPLIDCSTALSRPSFRLALSNISLS